MARSVKIHFADGSHVPGCPTNQHLPSNVPHHAHWRMKMKVLPPYVYHG